MYSGTLQLGGARLPVKARLRFTLDGTTPTTALGFLIPAGRSITVSAADAAAVKFIAAVSAGLLNAV
jgi:hypothetical protein